ncbi:hypothetical protein AYO49_02125 [Verrucomicrobiaceae bacterium SCGC AG-212-N21]|nr:hypothetical protein AYO49_02125 [Verrucomicrobiaceae bacterium SCGC AG-212-N21]
MIRLLIALPLIFFASLRAGEPPFQIKVGNLVYSMDQKTSVCFADAFLGTAGRQTGLPIAPAFVKLRLAEQELFTTPFCIFTGTGDFKLAPKERDNLSSYLQRGGFLVASPGCSDQAWNRAFQREIEAVFPNQKLDIIPMTHPIFSMITKVPTLTLNKSSGKPMLRGLTIDGRLALVFSPDGLNDTHHTQGCCCCGGNEITQSEAMNVNLLMYALLY